jgi:CHAP domain
MGTANGLITQARKLIGTTEHPAGSNSNFITAWYGFPGAWCDMTVSYEAAHSDNLTAIGGKFAYCPAHAEWFKSRGRWHYGISGIRAGDVVFFEWSGRRTTVADHVGIVERVLSDGTIYTIEGNIGDACRREHRDGTYVAGYGRPLYDAAPAAAEELLKTLVDLGTDKPFDVAPGQRKSIAFDLEYTGGDPLKVHTDGLYPSIFPEGKALAPYAIRADVQLKALAPGQRLTLELCKYDRKSNDYVRTIVSEDFDGIDGGSFSKVLSAVIPMSDAYKYRVDIVNRSASSVTVVTAHWQVAH